MNSSVPKLCLIKHFTPAYPSGLIFGIKPSVSALQSVSMQFTFSANMLSYLAA